MHPPETSTTLLRCLGQDAQSARWGDFVARYEPLMRAFLASRFPTVPADDIMQETLIALVDAMPTYRYSPRVDIRLQGQRLQWDDATILPCGFQPGQDTRPKLLQPRLPPCAVTMAF